MVTTTKVAHSTHSVYRHHSIANVQDEVMKHYRFVSEIKTQRCVQCDSCAKDTGSRLAV